MYQKQGFTLIELLVVVLIIGILASMALSQYQTAVTKSRLTELKTLVSSIKMAEELYYMANGEYTKNFEDLDIELPGRMKENNAMWAPSSNTQCSLNYIPRSVFCVNFSSSKLVSGWETWLDQSAEAPQTLCYAYGGNAAANKVCLSEGGTNPHTGEGYTFYIMP